MIRAWLSVLISVTMVNLVSPPVSANDNFGQENFPASPLDASYHHVSHPANTDFTARPLRFAQGGLYSTDAAEATPGKKKPWYKNKWVLITGIYVVVIAVVVLIANSGGGSDGGGGGGGGGAY